MNVNDTNTNLEELKKRAQQLIDERDWQQFHSPKDLSMSLSVEANELMEKFLWITTKESFNEVDKNRTEIEDEVADVLFCIINFCNTSNIDITTAFFNKIKKFQQKYPVEKSKGKSDKYDKL